MKRPTNTTLTVATLWAAVLVSHDYFLAEVTGWATLAAVLVMAQFEQKEKGR